MYLLPMKTALVHHMKKRHDESWWEVPELATDLAQSTGAFPPPSPAIRPAWCSSGIVENLLKLENRTQLAEYGS